MSKTTRYPYTEVMPIASHICEALRPYCDRIEIAGSLRRNRPTIGDIDLVALPRQNVNLFGDPVPGPTILETFLYTSGVKLVKDGDMQKQFAYGRFTVDLYLPQTAAHWGAIFTIRTGSPEFNKWVMAYRCKQVGISFSEGIITHYRRGRLDTPEEGDVFDALEMDFVPPEYREHNVWMAYMKDEASQ